MTTVSQMSIIDQLTSVSECKSPTDDRSARLYVARQRALCYSSNIGS